jgi:glycogen debranching enzyme
MSDNTISTLDGSTFLVSNPNGDVDARPDQPEGLFFKDTRHLSKWTLTIDGIALDVLSTDSIEYYYAQHFCIPPTGTIYKNPTLSLVRRRFVGNGFVEELTVLNHGSEVENIELRVDFGSDFCDLFEVKDALKKKGAYYQTTRGGRQVLGLQARRTVSGKHSSGRPSLPQRQRPDHLDVPFRAPAEVSLDHEPSK